MGELAGLGLGMHEGELGLWMAFLKDHDPRVTERRLMDERFGMLLALTANIHSTGRTFKARDFFPAIAPEINEEQELQAMALAGAGKIVIEKKR